MDSAWNRDGMPDDNSFFGGGNILDSFLGLILIIGAGAVILFVVAFLLLNIVPVLQIGVPVLAIALLVSYGSVGISKLLDGFNIARYGWWGWGSLLLLLVGIYFIYRFFARRIRTRASAVKAAVVMIPLTILLLLTTDILPYYRRLPIMSEILIGITAFCIVFSMVRCLMCKIPDGAIYKTSLAKDYYEEMFPLPFISLTVLELYMLLKFSDYAIVNGLFMLINLVLLINLDTVSPQRVMSDMMTLIEKEGRIKSCELPRKFDKTELIPEERDIFIEELTLHPEVVRVNDYFYHAPLFRKAAATALRKNELVLPDDIYKEVNRIRTRKELHEISSWGNSEEQIEVFLAVCPDLAKGYLNDGNPYLLRRPDSTSRKTYYGVCECCGTVFQKEPGKRYCCDRCAEEADFAYRLEQGLENPLSSELLEKRLPRSPQLHYGDNCGPVRSGVGLRSFDEYVAGA